MCKPGGSDPNMEVRSWKFWPNNLGLLDFGQTRACALTQPHGVHQFSAFDLISRGTCMLDSGRRMVDLNVDTACERHWKNIIENIEDLGLEPRSWT